MIEVRCLGHIATSVGAKAVILDGAKYTAEEVVEAVRGMSKEAEPGFTKYNTLLLVEDGEAGVAAASGTTVSSGQRVVLIPFSHGG